ncbi:hypothetical protein BDN71DRAFT_1386602, partial [Pleurotus eryngii]
KQDPTIRSARQNVSDAETAERDADLTSVQDRISVKEAREHVKVLEKGAEEVTKRAKAKQAEAKVVSKSARDLGKFS